MKRKLTLAFGLFISAAGSSSDANAQFFNYMPEMSNYIRGNVKNEVSGLTFTYRIQNDSTLALKTVILRTDNTGQALWMKEAGSNFTSYTLAPDTSVILTGFGTVSGGNRIALLQKVDKTGAILWKKILKISGADVGIGNIMVNENNTIFATLTRSSFLSSTYYSKAAVAAYDMNGAILWTKNFGNSGLTTDFSFTRTMLAENGDFIGIADVRGSQNASANGMMITRITPQGTIVFSKYIDFLTTHNQFSVTGLVETSSNKLVIGGRLMTDQISTYPNTMWLASMDSAGNLIQQKVYSGGEDVGEQLHGLDYANGKIYAYLHFYSPFDSVKFSNWVGTINESTLTFDAQNATKLDVAAQDPYGNVSNSFCISNDGKPTVAAGFYCTEKLNYLPVMQQWSSSLSSGCVALDRTQALTDSAAVYPITNFISQSSFSVTDAIDTTTIAITDVPLPQITTLCDGCASPPPTNIAVPNNKDMFRLYPNPSDGHYLIEIKEATQEAKMIVTNIIGEIIYQSQLKGTQQSIDLSAQPAGIYFVQIRTSDGRIASSKLIKDR